MKTYGVGVIGCGAISRTYLRNITTRFSIPLLFGYSGEERLQFWDAKNEDPRDFNWQQSRRGSFPHRTLLYHDHAV